MVKSTLVAAMAVATGVLTFFVTSLCFWRCRRRRLLRLRGSENPQPGPPIVKQLHHQPEIDTKKRLSNFVFPRGGSPKPLFSWEDHPSLVNDAVENGWTQFAFAGYMSSSPSARSRLLGLCTAAGEIENEIAAEISWEVTQGSVDFMQKIRLNSGSKRTTSNILSSSPTVFSVIRTALPLPGPPLASFPQEGYFEITILHIGGDENEPAKEGERMKLMAENHNLKTNNKVSSVEETKPNGRTEDHEDEKGEDIVLSLGLISGASAPSKLPGSFPGSIGFNSNGSVYLDGMKLVFESEKEEWGRAEKVIGCGFDPKQKKVFFTVDSEVVHVVCCKSEEFGSPLYPAVAAGMDVTMVVNLGQSVFKYRAAQRTPNPCFVSPMVNAAGASNGNGYEDSRELFSMGMIDAKWSNKQTEVEDEESDEIELFEIFVENSRQTAT